MLPHAISVLALSPALFASNEPAFPRGPGLYFSLPKLIFVLIIYLGWVRTSWWMDQDARKLKLSHLTWNPIMFACGVVGVLAIGLLPWFLAVFPLLLALWLTPTLIYVNQRNAIVEETDRVLTAHHLQMLAAHYLKMKAPKKEEGEKEKVIDIRFVSKNTNQSAAEENRFKRAEESKGYKAALKMVYEAIQQRATDIHMEPTKDEMIVRFRIDGMLVATPSFTRAMGDSVLNIFKVIAALDITEKRKPQDGSFSAVVEGRDVDFRVATAGSVVGEKLVMRILDKTRAIASLADLGMREKMRDTIHDIAKQPHGLFIVCGPTGAGKSTTLYACLNQIDRYQKNVISVENPVEYQIENVTQIEVNPKAGKTFAGELRSILRQDPDVIYIGEIRDQETAEIACQAAQTGHMVFTTLHANDTVTAIGRLIDLGVQPFLISSSLSAVLGQRLVRVLCPKCKVKYKPNPDMLRKTNLPADRIKYFYRPPEAEGEEVCDHCGGTGYFGRTGVFELLEVKDRLREMIRENPNFNAIRQEAIKNGMEQLQQDGLRQVIDGRTSIQELLRVCK
jgi:type II secretory ATPase GspE/PulE/Tfp pilus assembly ATPase PilB-like protein